MKFSQDNNPFDKKLEPKGFAAARILLRGKRVSWEELSTEAGGLSTRTLGDIKRRFAANGINVVSIRKQLDGGTFYELQAASADKAKPKKAPKTARPTGVRKGTASSTPAEKAPAKKIIKKKAA